MWKNTHPRGLIPLYQRSPPSGVAKISDSTPLDEPCIGYLKPTAGERYKRRAWLRVHWQSMRACRRAAHPIFSFATKQPHVLHSPP